MHNIRFKLQLSSKARLRWLCAFIHAKTYRLQDLGGSLKSTLFPKPIQMVFSTFKLEYPAHFRLGSKP